MANDRVGPVSVLSIRTTSVHYLSRFQAIRSRRAKAGNSFNHVTATSMVPTPPSTTEPTGPNRVAVEPSGGRVGLL
jgi:hypothetical protein